ncbi:MAG: IclR family transcriptional regulator [Desulfobacteraceae bacterium]|jgi:DNA-binding IclR family transcriptional regulator
MVKSATRVIQILESVGASKNGISHAELSAALNIPKGSLSLLLADLVAHDFLALRKEEERRYVIGPQVLVIAGKYLTDLDIVQLGRPVVHEVMSTTDESSALAVRKGDEMLIVYGENCSQPLKRAVEIGYRAPLYTTAGGKAILAHQSEEEIDHYLSSVKLTPKTHATITDSKTLLKELKAIRLEKIAYSREERYEGLISMAAPVFDLFGSVITAIVVTLPTIRFNPKSEKHVKETLNRASEKLSRQLGFNPNTKGGKRN